MSGTYTVRPAWKRGRKGDPVRWGWHLMNGEEWAQTFAHKRKAQAEADRLNGEFVQCEPCSKYDPDATCPQCPGRATAAA